MAFRRLVALTLPDLLALDALLQTVQQPKVSDNLSYLWHIEELVDQEDVLCTLVVPLLCRGAAIRNLGIHLV